MISRLPKTIIAKKKLTPMLLVLGMLPFLVCAKGAEGDFAGRAAAPAIGQSAAFGPVGKAAAEAAAKQLKQLADQKSTDNKRNQAGQTEMDGFLYCEAIPLSYALQKYTYEACGRNGVDYDLVLALMWRESRFQVNAVHVNTNGTRDNGIMQINDVNRGWLLEQHGIVDLMDPKQNIEAGTIMLGGLVEKYDVHRALMAYQYGEQGMKRKLWEGVTTNRQISMLYEKQQDIRSLLQQNLKNGGVVNTVATEQMFL